MSWFILAFYFRLQDHRESCPFPPMVLVIFCQLFVIVQFVFWPIASSYTYKSLPSVMLEISQVIYPQEDHLRGIHKLRWPNCADYLPTNVNIGWHLDYDLGPRRLTLHHDPEMSIEKKINTNWINAKYCQVMFHLPKWCCRWVFFGNPWSNESDANVEDSDCTVRMLLFFSICQTEFLF